MLLIVLIVLKVEIYIILIMIETGLEKFEIIDKIGEGIYGTVFKA